jgi:hypothetical protein
MDGSRGPSPLHVTPYLESAISAITLARQRTPVAAQSGISITGNRVDQTDAIEMFLSPARKRSAARRSSRHGLPPASSV